MLRAARYAVCRPWGDRRAGPQEATGGPPHTRMQSRPARRGDREEAYTGASYHWPPSGFEVLLYMGIAEPHVSLGVIKPLMWELHDACVRPCALIPGAATLPLRPAVILFSLPCGLGSGGQAAGQSCQLSVPCGRL